MASLSKQHTVLTLFKPSPILELSLLKHQLFALKQELIQTQSQLKQQTERALSFERDLEHCLALWLAT